MPSDLRRPDVRSVAALSTWDSPPSAACDRVSTMRLALSRVDEIHTDPEPEVQIVRVVGLLIVIRALVWHQPTLRDERAAIDAALRGVLADLDAAGIALDGPTDAKLYADASESATSD